MAFDQIFTLNFVFAVQNFEAKRDRIGVSCRMIINSWQNIQFIF